MNIKNNNQSKMTSPYAYYRKLRPEYFSDTIVNYKPDSHYSKDNCHKAVTDRRIEITVKVTFKNCFHLFLLLLRKLSKYLL